MYVLAGFASQRESNAGKRILIVDEDPAARAVVAGLLTEAGYQADGCASWEEVSGVLTRRDHTVLVKDQRRAYKDSLVLARELMRSHPGVSFILLSADEPSGSTVAALQSGVFDFMTRSFEPETLQEHLLDAVRRTFDAEWVRGDAARPGRLALCKDPVADVLIGECLGIVEARERLRAALADDAPVLVSGEAGTEKLAVARLLHDRSSSPGPLVVASSGRSATALDLATGSGPMSSDPAGGEPAGSLFVADVGALNSSWQVELAKRLSVVDVGAPRARIMAGLSQPPSPTWQGSVLARLFENAGSHRVTLPPLRERGRDVLILAEHFAEQGRLALGDALLRISPAAAEALTRYSWPGNVDELRFAIQHAASLCSGSVIEVDDLPPSIGFSLEGAADESGTRLEVQSLEDMELSYILRVLDAVGGNKASAARLLGVDRTTLYRKLQRQEHAGVLSVDSVPASRRIRK